MQEFAIGFREQVKRTVARFAMFSPGDMVVVGISGGPDSMALAHVLASLRDELGVGLHLAHLNHMLRGADADADAQAVGEWAAGMGLDCTVEAIDVPAYLRESGEGAEAGARAVRHAFLTRVAERVGANRIALGHNADDVAETILINLLRGAGTTGLAGIPPVRDGLFVRPLIERARAEIERYCDESQLPVRIDATNLAPVFLRNRVRLGLLPLLKAEYNPNVIRALGRTAEVLRAEDEYLEETAATALGQIVEDRAETGNRAGLWLRLDKLNSLPRALQRRVIRLAVVQVAGSRVNLGLERVERVLELAAEGRTGAAVQLPRQVVAVREYETLWVKLRSTGDGSSRGLDVSGSETVDVVVPGRTTWPLSGLILETELRDVSGRGERDRLVEEVRHSPGDLLVLDAAAICGALRLRARHPGDRFQSLGAPGERKLKEVLIDLKVPQQERDRIPLLTDDLGILWVVGYRSAERGAIKGETARALVLKVTASGWSSI